MKKGILLFTIGAASGLFAQITVNNRDDIKKSVKKIMKSNEKALEMLKDRM